MIILDTNVLIYAIKSKIDLTKFIDEEIVIPTSAIKELEKLSKKNTDAKLALKLSEKYRVIKVESTGDDGIIEAAVKYGGNVITNDRALQKSLKGKNIRVTAVTKRMVRKL